MTNWIPFATEKQMPHVGIVSRAIIMAEPWLETIDFCNSLGWANSILAHYNYLEPTTYRNGTVSGETDFHVDISKSPRGE